MNPLMMGAGVDDGNNLFSILVNAAFGFVAGLMVFIGVHEVIAYGSTVATYLLKISGYGQQMAAFGFATAAAPYVVLAPLGGFVVKQLTAVRTLRSFAFFVGAVLAGFVCAYLTKGYFLTIVH